jgi:hypothetical protein
MDHARALEPSQGSRSSFGIRKYGWLGIGNVLWRALGASALHGNESDSLHRVVHIQNVIY